jgi:NADH-quinone oxidoreductase subunit N
MYFDEPVMKIIGRSDMIHSVILAICAVAISPLGYLATRWLGGLSFAAAAALFSVG